MRRRMRARHGAGLFDGLVVDLFAGGGGASLALERGLDRCVDLAVNHDPIAVAMHQVNHPRTLHHCQDVFEVDPLEATRGKPVDVLWASPDCTHFSRSRGSKPVKKEIRSLAWVVIKWAKLIGPRLILLENVREFREWGPVVKKIGPDGRPVLGPDGKPLYVPCPLRKSQTFQRWVGQLRSLGYTVDWRDLNAADFGAATHRRRLFLVARRDGLPIAWPEPTHGPGRIPYEQAAQFIDWSLPCYSIFLTREEVAAGGFKCIRPLAAKTMARVAAGVKKFVIDSPRPFLVCTNHGGEHFRGQATDRPLATITGRHGYGLVAPHLTAYYGEGKHQDTRGNRVDEPLRTITSNNRFGLVAAFMAKHYGGVVGHDLERPIGTITSRDHHSVGAAFLARLGQTGGNGSYSNSLESPLTTITSKAEHLLAAANLVHMNHGDVQWSDLERPLRTILAGGNHHYLVESFLSQFNGRSIGQGCSDPLNTITSVDRFGLVTVEGIDFAIVDICLRMLRAHELFGCQGFPADYKIAIEVGGRPLSNEAQVHLCGNSVSPQPAEALVRANAGVLVEAA